MVDPNEQLTHASPPSPGGGSGMGRWDDRNPLPVSTRPRRALIVELGLIFLLAFAPALLSLVATMLVPPADTSAAPAAADPVTATFSALTVALISWLPILVLGYLLKHNGEGLAAIGFTRIRRRDVGFGVLLWLASHVVVVVLSPLFAGFGTNEVAFLPEGMPLWFLVGQSLLIALTAGFTEEILVRGYGQTRLEQLGVPPALIVAAPTGFWAVLHVYQGVGAALTIFGLGLLYAAYYHRTRRLWPVIIAHVLFDLTVLTLVMLGY